VPGHVRRRHDAEVRATSGRLLRSTALWDDWVLTFKVGRGVLDAVCGHDGAYLIGRPEEGGAHYRVLEAAGDPGVLLALLSPHLTTGTRLKMPDDGPGRVIAERVGAQVSRRTRTGIMALPLADDAPGADAFSAFLELDAF